MSDVIDRRTVEMRFDKEDFEKNVDSCIKSLDNLKKSLNFQDSADSFEVIEKGLKSLDIEKASKSVESLSSRFKSLFNETGRFYLIKEGAKAFDSLKSTVVNLTKSLTGLDQAQAGLQKYWDKTSAVQTIMAATGKTVDEVSRSIEKLNWFSDETSYSFTDMVENIGKFTSAGIDLDKAVSAMEGISNWVSTSGRGKNEAARAMYNLSQAISTGAVKMTDWRSIQLANLSTTEFKQTVIDTGIALGKLKKVGDDYFTTVGKQQKITTETFESTLSTGWFDSELLVSVLERYSDFTNKVYDFMNENPEYDTASKAMLAMREEAAKTGEAFDELGYKWFLSSQEAKSWADVADSLKDAVSTGWSQTFEYIFGNYEQSRHLWTDMANQLYEVFATPGNERNDFLYEAMTSNYQKLKDAIDEAGLSVSEFEQQIYDSHKGFEDTKAELDALINKYGSLSAAFENGEIKTDWVVNAFDDLVKSGKDSVQGAKTFEEVQQIIKDTLNGDYGVGNERFEKFKELGYNAESLQKLVNKFHREGKVTLEDLEEVGIKITETYSASWKDFVEENKELIEYVDEASGRDLLIGSFKNVLTSFVNSTKLLREGFKSLFNITPETVHNALANVYKFTESIKISEETIENVKAKIAEFRNNNFLQNAGNFFSGIKTGIGSTFTSIGEYIDKIKKSFSSLSNGQTGIFDILKDTFSGLFGKKSKRVRVSKTDEFFEKYSKYMSKRTRKMIENVKNGLVNDNAMNYLQIIPDKFGEVKDKIISKFQDLKNKINELWTSYKETGLYKTLNDFWNWSRPLLKTLVEKLVNNFSFQNISSLFTSLAAFNASKLSKSVSGFVDTFTKQFKDADILKNIADTFSEKRWKDTLKSISESFSDALKPFKDQLNAETKEINSRAFLNFAISIGIIAAALFLISKIPVEDLEKAGITLGAIVLVLVGVALALGKINKIKFDFSGVTTGRLLGIAAMIVLVSIAMRNIATATGSLLESVKEIGALGWNKALAGVGGVFALIAALAGAVTLIGHFGGFIFMGSVLAILALAGAVRILVGAVKEFAEISKNRDEFARSITAVIGLITALGAAVFASGFFTLGNLFGGSALAILSMAAAVRILVGAVKEFQHIPEADLEKSVKSIQNLLNSLGKATFWSGFLSFGGIGRALAIFSFVGAIYALQKAVLTFKDIPAAKLDRAVSAVTNMIDALKRAVFVTGIFNNGLGNAATILALAKSVQWIAEVVEKFMILSADSAKFEKARSGVRDIMATITGITAIMGVLNRLGMGSSLSQAVTFVAIGFALRMIGETLQGLTKLDKDRLENAGLIVAGIGVVLTIFANTMGKISPGTLSAIGGAAMLIGFANAVQTLANSLIALSKLDDAALKKGGSAIGQIMLLMMGIIVVMSKNPLTGNIKSVGLNFVAFAAALAIMAFAAERLGALDTRQLGKGVAAISVLMLVLSAMIKISGKAAGVSNFPHAVTIFATAAAVYVLARAVSMLSEIPKGNLIASAGVVAGLLLAIRAIGKIGIAATDIKSSLGLLILAGAVGVLAYVAKTFANMEWAQLGKAGAALAGMGTAMWAIAKFVNIGIKQISLGAIAKLGIAIGVVGVILAALGGIYNIPGFKEWMHDGGDFLIEIGRAIGGFFGAIIGGFNEGITSTLPAVGTAMSEFATNAETFFSTLDKYKSFDIIEVAQGLMTALNNAIWADIKYKLANLFSDEETPQLKSLEAFGNGLSAMAPGVGSFLSVLEGADVTNVTPVTEALQTLSTIATEQEYISTNPLKTFGENIKEASTSLSEAITSLNGIPIPNTNATKAMEVLNEMANVDISGFKLEVKDGFFGLYIRWGRSLAGLAADMSSATEGIKTFIESSNSLEFTYSGGKTKAQIMAEVLTQYATIKVHRSGGFITWFSSYKNAITNFATDMAAAMPKLQEFLTSTKDLKDVNMTNISTVAEIFKKFTEINFSEGFIFNLSPSDVADAYLKGVESLNSLADVIDEDKMNKVYDFMSYFDGTKTLSTTFVDSIPGLLRGLIDKTKGLAVDSGVTDGLNAIVGALAYKDDINNDYFTDLALDVTSSVGNLGSAVANGDLARARETYGFISDFVYRIFRLQNEFDSNAFSSNFSSAIQIINDQIGTLKNNKDAITSFQDFFTTIQNIFSYTPTKFDPDGFIQEMLQWYSGWLDELTAKDPPDFSAWEKSFGSVAGIINSFTVDDTKFSRISHFLDILQQEFKAPKTLLGGKDKNFFKDIGKDFVNMDEELKKSDFTKTTMVSSQIRDFATSMQGLFNINPQLLSSKFSGILKAVNEAFLGDGTEETPGIDETIEGKIDMFSKLFESISNAAAGVVASDPTTFSSFISQLATAIEMDTTLAQAGQSIADDFAAAFDTTLATVEESFGVFNESLTAPLNTISDTFKGMVPDGAALVSFMLQGMALAFSGEWADRTLDAASQFMENLKSVIQISVMVQSPSKWMNWIGEMMMEGFANGIEQNSPEALAMVNSFVDETKSALGKLNSLRGSSTEGIDTAYGWLPNTDETREMLSDALNILDGIPDEDLTPVITPELDLSKVEEGANQISEIVDTSTQHARSIATSFIDKDASHRGIVDMTSGHNVTLVQNNYSPKPLSRLDIYRQTKNQLALINNLLN